MPSANTRRRARAETEAPLADEPTAEDPFAGAAPGDVIGINIQVPSTWYEFDVHPATVNRSIREVVAERVSVLTPIGPGRRPTDPWRRVRLVELPDAGPSMRLRTVLMLLPQESPSD